LNLIEYRLPQEFFEAIFCQATDLLVASTFLASFKVCCNLRKGGDFSPAAAAHVF
jgi:hypothetical protein